MWNGVWEGARVATVKKIVYSFPYNFEGWMNLNEQEMIGNVFWLKEVGCDICWSSFELLENVEVS